MLDDDQILNYIGTELQQSAGGGDSLEANRQAALSSYLGQPNGKETEGRSQVTSTDVADAIEWIMPEVVKAFTQNNEVVTFDPDYEGDEKQAELESQYVYDILMKDNDGFIVIHQFVKDALLQKNGYIKVFYSEDVEQTTESYTGVTPQEMEVILSDPQLELTELSEHEIAGPDGQPFVEIDMRVSRTVDDSKINVVSVPPEEFRVSKNHNSVSLSDSRFTAHVYLRTAGELVSEGHDKDFVDSLPSSSQTSDDRSYRFYMQGESVSIDQNESLDPSLREIEISECYMRMDMNEDGIAEFVKIEVAGGDNPSHILSVEEIDENPFISATAILMSHKLHGLSIYDRLKSIEEQKTTLWRNIFDNMYLQNNQRTIVVENQVNLDDLMVSRPGGIIRAKRLDAVAPYQTPAISGDAYRMMDYLDQVRAGRSGVSPEGPVTDSMIGDRVGSEGVAQMMSQKEELVGLMIRVFAETGIKPLCYMIRNQVVRHQDVVRDYKFRGQWKQVNPAAWRKKRSGSTVRVGTGSGNRKQQLGALSTISLIQEKLQATGSAMVSDAQVYNAVDDFAKFSGMTGAGKYLLDPESPEFKEKKQAMDQQNQQMQQMQQQMEQAQVKAQTDISQAEMGKAQAAMKNVELKGIADEAKSELESYKLQSNNELSSMKQQLEEAKAIIANTNKADDLEFKYWDASHRHNIERDRIESSEKMARDNNQQSNSNEQ